MHDDEGPWKVLVLRRDVDVSRTVLSTFSVRTAPKRISTKFTGNSYSQDMKTRIYALYTRKSDYTMVYVLISSHKNTVEFISLCSLPLSPHLSISSSSYS